MAARDFDAFDNPVSSSDEAGAKVDAVLATFDTERSAGPAGEPMDAVKRMVGRGGRGHEHAGLGDEVLQGIDESRERQARAIVQALARDSERDPLKVCVMVRVRRLFDVNLSNESFTVMIHVVTCWLCEGDAEHDRMSDEFVKAHGGNFVHDADPDLAFYAPDFRPRIAIRNLSDGKATLDGDEGENFFYRSYIDGKTLVTWEVEKLCVIGSLFDLVYYPVDVQALDVCLELKTGLRETVFIPFPPEGTGAHATEAELAQVLTDRIHLPDYALIPGHE